MPSRSETATVLATGCSGFLGRHCLEALVRHGFRVHAVSRAARTDQPADKIVWHNLDLQSRGPVERLIATLRPTHLLHLAWVTMPDVYRYAPENLDWLNASLALVRSFAEHGGQRFVGVGSCAEYAAAAGACAGGQHPGRPGHRLWTVQGGVLDGDASLCPALRLFRSLGTCVSAVWRGR